MNPRYCFLTLSPVEGKFHVYPEMAAAGLWTTPTDLAKFGIEVQLSLQGRLNKVLSKATAERMVTPFVGEENGLGLFIQKRGQNVTSDTTAPTRVFGRNCASTARRATARR